MTSGSNNSSSESYLKYNWIDGAESLEKYRPGGYHPVMVGDLLHDRYRIVDKLGYGGYSTVWLARDTHLKRYVAVKVGIANSLPHETKILRALSEPTSVPSSVRAGLDSIPVPLDEFEVTGPNGTHPCYTTTPARRNLREVSFSRLFPLDVARALSGGLILAVAYMHSQGYVHGDIHLRNILVKLPASFDSPSTEEFYEQYGKPETVPVTQRNGGSLPPHEFTSQDAPVLLSDFGEAFSPVSSPRSGEYCHTPVPYCPPEALFEPQAPLSYPADIWSLATAVWEILGMKAIFSTEAPEDEVTSQQIDVLGPMPQTWYSAWEERSYFFDEDGRPVEGREVWPVLDLAFEQGVRDYRRQGGVGDFGDDETAAILELMRGMLRFKPEERLTIEEVLQSEWILKWVMPDYDHSLQAFT
ncbi:kinase-like protein [Aspergillus neoniger CBS 115656]|uniref:non-specific serine/threonine protein kinase n=1 Tax=Aspergillus neoniger (strain CBS 115656) TaxID=1448310 RepID=A0A318YVG2_ASPNB|nr:kinase-like protein [Aspergillus neoniger CBS 115656]PYH31868.1 kinase-like protein [Aspergillus neoniger CBS 115656]